MKRTWVRLLVVVLISVVIVLGPPFLKYSEPEVVTAGVLTFLVALSVVVIPILVGKTIYQLNITSPSPWTLGDYGVAWMCGIFVITFVGVIIGAIWLVLSSTYLYILNLLGG